MRLLKSIPLALIALLIGGAVSDASSSSRTVALKNFAFSPSSLTIKAGSSVTFRFEDGRVSHNVTSKGGSRFHSSSSMSSGAYTVRFTRRGTYRYECTIHPSSMQGKIVVR